MVSSGQKKYKYKNSFLLIIKSILCLGEPDMVKIIHRVLKEDNARQITQPEYYTSR